MFNVQQAANLNKVVCQAFPNPGTRLDAFTLATAYAIARGLPMPSTAVDSPDNYFMTTAMTGLYLLIDNINDAVLLDRHAARAAVKSFWMVRYHSLYPSEWEPESGYDFFCTTSRVPVYFTAQQFSLLSENKQGIWSIVSHLNKLFAEAK